MVKMRIKGRLGNQLFIYGFARYLCERYHQTALLYDRKEEADTLWHSHLDRFKLHESVRFTSDKREVLDMGLKRKALFLWDRLNCRCENNRQVHDRQLKNMPLYNKNGLILLEDGSCELPSQLPEEIFCDGYFQSDLYLNPIRDKLLEELVPITDYTSEEKEFLNRIHGCKAVCITIRLGDYIGNITHQVCTKEFYMKAMSILYDMEPNCKFFIFSDDVEMAKRILEFKYPVVYDAGKSLDAVSLKIMSQCRHFIISNSSFSWWAQYLGEYEGKIVISPDRWYAQDIPCDIMQDNWIKIGCRSGKGEWHEEGL